MTTTTGLRIKVVPGASEDRIVGWLGQTLKIRVRAQPERGKANLAVIMLLAEALAVVPERIDIVRGHASQMKRVEIKGMTDEALRKKLNSRV